MKTYAYLVYGIVEKECDGLDSVYEDFIIYLVGIFGLNKLKEYKLIETCGVVNGKQLYALCGIKE